MSNKYVDENGFWLDIAKIRVRMYRLDYRRIALLLDKGLPVFIPVNRKTAFFAKKKLSKMLKAQVEAFPSDYEGTSGYLFMVHSSATQT